MPSTPRPTELAGVLGGCIARGLRAAIVGGLLALAAPIAAVGPRVADGLQAYQDGDYIKALDIWVQLAGQGDPVAQFGLGTLYQEGKGVQRDEAQATEWFRKAAEQGFVPAQFNLGNAYQHGRGVRPSYPQAVHWWRKAAERDFAPAQFNVGTAYLHGRGVARDREQALDWYRRAADNGHQPAREALEQLAGATAQPGVADAAAEAAPKPVRQPKRALLRETAWVMGQPPGHYTVQLLATGRAETARAFARRRIRDAPYAIFPYTSQGKRWFGVLYGAYSDLNAARRAAQQLARPLRKSAPWIRRFGSLQKAAAPPQP